MRQARSDKKLHLEVAVYVVHLWSEIQIHFFKRVVGMNEIRIEIQTPLRLRADINNN